MKTLVTQIKMQKSQYLINLLCMIGTFLLGLIVEIVFMDVDNSTEMICMGSLMTMVVIIMVMIFLGGFHMTSICNYALMMGQTRKAFIWSYLSATFMTFTVCAIAWEILHVLELFCIKMINNGVQVDDIVGDTVTWKVWLAIILASVSFGSLLGASIIKFGKIAFWFWWGLMMLVFIGGPRLLVFFSKMPPEHAMVQWIMHVVALAVEHAALTIGIAVSVLTVVSVTVTWLMLRKHQVNV